jgi:hypothetical protein
MGLVQAVMLAAVLIAQQGGGRSGKHSGGGEEPDLRLPSGKSQRQEILKADHAKSKADAAELVTLAQELQEELEKSEHQVLNVKLVKKAEDIEKLARKIKDRMKRY